VRYLFGIPGLVLGLAGSAAEGLLVLKNAPDEHFIRLQKAKSRK
jgi:hypothetical protein